MSSDTVPGTPADDSVTGTQNPDTPRDGEPTTPASTVGNADPDGAEDESEDADEQDD